jgi:hypothetical protein
MAVQLDCSSAHCSAGSLQECVKCSCYVLLPIAAIWLISCKLPEPWFCLQAALLGLRVPGTESQHT